MIKPIASLAAAVFLAVNSLSAQTAAPNPSAEAAKNATVLLLGSRGTSTAVCISPDSHLYVTNIRSAEDAADGSLAVVFNPSQKDEQKCVAHVLKTFPEAGIAILKVETERKVAAVKLGDDSQLFETQTLFTLGYPYGQDTAQRPALVMGSGHITSLQKKGDALQAIQFDAAFNPGGPILDEKGELVGLGGVVSVNGAWTNYIIPVSVLKKIGAASQVTVQAPVVTYAKRYEPADFTIHADWLIAPITDPTVSLEITVDGKARSVTATKQKDGSYLASLAPLPPGYGKLSVTLRLADREVSGLIDDMQIHVQGAPRMLSEFHTLVPVLNPAEKEHAHIIGLVVDGVQSEPVEQLYLLKVETNAGIIVVKIKDATTIKISGQENLVKQVKPQFTPNMPQEFREKLLRDQQEKRAKNPFGAVYKVTVAAGDAKPVVVQGDLIIPPDPATIPPVPPAQAVEIAKAAAAMTPTPQPIPGSPNTQIIDLPSPADEVAAGEDGRVLIFHLKDAKKLAVFDVTTLKMRGSIDVPDRVMFAGGKKYLLVLDLAQNLIMRYSLANLQKELTVINPMGTIKTMAMGYSSPQIALFVAEPPPHEENLVFHFFNADLMRPVITSKESPSFSKFHSQLMFRTDVRASGDGTLYTLESGGFNAITYKGGLLTLFNDSQSLGLPVPGPDGSVVFTNETVIKPNLVPVISKKGDGRKGTHFIPSYDPDYFVGVTRTDDFRPLQLAIYSSSTNQPIAELDPFNEMTFEDGLVYTPGGTKGPIITTEKRFHYYPQWNLFITFPDKNDRLVVRHLDTKQLAAHAPPVASAATPGGPAATAAADPSAPQTIPLPSPMDDVVAGEDGGVLIFHLSGAKKLAVFDVQQLKMRGIIDLADDHVLYAGGSRYLLVAYPAQNLLVRYSLQTLQKELTVTNTLGEVRHLAMGYSSPRYALIGTKNDTSNPGDSVTNMFNVEKMTFEVTTRNNNEFVFLGFGSRAVVRASGDGETYGVLRGGVAPSGFVIFTYKNNRMSLFTNGEPSAGLPVPNFDGSLIFTSEQGIFTPRYSPVIKSGNKFLPSYLPGYFIGLGSAGSDSFLNAKSNPVCIYAAGGNQPIAYLERFEEMTGNDFQIKENDPVTPEKRFHYYPQWNLFLTIPRANDRLVVRHVDLKKIMDDKGIDYLYVTTAAPGAKVRQQVHFKLTAVSKAGDAVFSLRSGPAGMTVGSDGTVNWQAPVQPVEAPVVIMVKDKSGREIRDAFTISVTN